MGVPFRRLRSSWPPSILYKRAAEDVGKGNAAIFEIHQMMLEDSDYLDAIKAAEVETRGTTAEHAVCATGESFVQAFAAMEGNEYMQARAVDMQNISLRLINILAGAAQRGLPGSEPFILVVHNLTPSETIQMEKSRLLGFITRRGFSNSHAAILARAMNVAALVGVDSEENWNGREVIPDGGGSCAYIDPTHDLCVSMKAGRTEFPQEYSQLQELKKKPSITLNGR